MNLIGERFGKLVVVKQVSNGDRGVRWECNCDCGEVIHAYTADLRTGHKTSCNCMKWNGTPKHKLSNSKIRYCYYNMRKRCDNPNHKDFKNYGGRGIQYCRKWDTFEGFLADMLEGYEEGLTLDRIDVNGDYEKDNCRWTSKKVQANNTRMNHYIEHKGETLTLSEIADKYDVDYELFRNRLKKGWLVEDALSDPKAKETITYNNITKTVSEFANEYNMSYHQLKKRLMRGWDIDRALTQPLREKQ